MLGGSLVIWGLERCWATVSWDSVSTVDVGAGLAVAGKLRLYWAHGFPGLLAKDLCWVVSVRVTESQLLQLQSKRALFSESLSPKVGCRKETDLGGWPLYFGSHQPHFDQCQTGICFVSC